MCWNRIIESESELASPARRAFVNRAPTVLRAPHPQPEPPTEPPMSEDALEVVGAEASSSQ